MSLNSTLPSATTTVAMAKMPAGSINHSCNKLPQKKKTFFSSAGCDGLLIRTDSEAALIHSGITHMRILPVLIILNIIRNLESE